jgi:HAD superfamily hydrolase (TIGR01484 family)
MYKALLSDVDGTLIQNKKDGTPSKAVIEAVKKGGKKIHIGIATSRPLFMLEDLFKKLPLSGPCIISGGSQIYDATTKKIVWKQPLTKESVAKTAAIFEQYAYPFFINDGFQDVPFAEAKNVKAPLGVFMPNVDPGVAEEIHQQLKHITDISAHQIAAHEPGKIILDITHALATKQHGVIEVAKILDIDPKEIIGVGDGYNDFPLLMACGLKIAMGNAVEELKTIADYIAPTVDEDGVAEVIKRFVL